jgi:dienelactone hydrolase
LKRPDFPVAPEQKSGSAVIDVDFTKAHDIPRCANNKGFLISSEDYARDILAAVTYLAKDSSIDPTRIHLIGWSFGGGASFSALALAEHESVKINSVVAFFPFCKGALAWKQPTPVPRSVANVERSSCAIHAARNSQWHCVQ